MSKIKQLYVQNINISNDITFSGVVETIKEHVESDSKHTIINDSSNSATELWSSSKITADLGLKLDVSNFNQPFGYAALDTNGLLPNTLVPPITLTKPIVYANIAARDADVGNVEAGDVAIVMDVQKTYMYAGAGAGYTELLATGSIATINGKSGGSVMIYTSDIPEVTNLYYTEARVSANADLVSNSNRISVVETYYESSSSEICDEVVPSTVSEINSLSQGTSFTPSAGTYRCTFNAQFELTKGGSAVSKCPDAINATIVELDALTYTAHAAAYGAGEVLFAGNYYIAGATTHTGVLEFDAQGDPDATWVISGGAAHDIAVGSSLVLTDGAQSCNIFYRVVGAFSVGTGVTIRGSYYCNAAIGIGVNCILDGRLFTTAGAITTSDTMGLPVGDAFAFDLGVASQFVLFDTLGDITNPTPAANPSNITSGIVACGAGTVLGFPPYDGIYTVDPETNPTIRIVFGIYEGAVLSPSSLTYVENTIPGKYYSVSMATTIVSTGALISARVGVDSVKGSVIVTNRTLFARRLV
jgi:hypothetical protein